MLQQGIVKINCYIVAYLQLEQTQKNISIAARLN